MWGKDKSIPNKEAGKRQTQAIPPILSKAAAPRSREVTPTGASQQGPPAKRQKVREKASPEPPPPDVPRQSAEDAIAAMQVAAKPKTGTTYVRPKQKGRPPAPPAGRNPHPASLGSIERLERAMVSGQLWHQACREANQDLPDDLPVSFTSPQQYIAAYEPLIFEEAREAILHARLDRYSHQAQASIVGLDALAGGGSEVRLTLDSGAQTVKEGAILILSSRALPAQANVEWLVEAAGAPPPRLPPGTVPAQPRDGAADASVLVAGIIRSCPSPGKGGTIAVSLNPRCTAHANEADPICGKALSALRPNRRLWAIIFTPLVTQQREFVALHKVPSMSVGEYMLQPEKLAALARQVEEQRGEKSLPSDVYGEGVKKQLSTQFDPTQFGAIAAATRHLDAREGEQTMPFVLICGPPGTGKTHTVTGVLNVWHLSHYTQHQNSIMATLRANVEQGFFSRTPSSHEQSMPVLASKPRLLVCAPSNAAADELLQRVMTSGFMGNDGRVYFPNVVRVGAPGANIGEKARAVLVNDLVQGLMDMDPRTWQAMVQSTRQQFARLCHQIASLQAHLSMIEIPEEEGAAREIAVRREMDSIRQLVECYDARSRLSLTLERLGLTSDLVMRRPGMHINEVKDSLELSYVADAEMVFTTLSSTGRNVFNRLPMGHFETVLIDEAAQASEVTTLQALVFGCRRVVLVGDPQQLPATVLSQRSKDLLFERSLFERLQKGGCPVHMLQVQYRMHPYIREFPSRHFYDNRLMDGKSVLERPPEVFYKNRLLKPYVFFDVSEGRDIRAQQGTNSGSRRNQEEADMVVALFQVLREELLAAVQRGELKQPVVVGVITPYREQVTCIQDTLRRVLGAQLASEVNVSTVDSYQGRQMDVIILSCVRANPAAKGVGFVDDMRRMNVSITRAKRALWVLGSAATLRQSPVWAALLQDAANRGLLIHRSDARSLFPHLPQFQADFTPPDGAHPPSGANAASSQPADRPRKAGHDLADQLLQEGGVGGESSGASKLRMLSELEAGTEPLPNARIAIPGLEDVALQPPTRPSSRQSQGSQKSLPSQPPAKESSPALDDSALYEGGEPRAKRAKAAKGHKLRKKGNPGGVDAAEGRAATPPIPPGGAKPSVPAVKPPSPAKALPSTAATAREVETRQPSGSSQSEPAQNQPPLAAQPLHSGAGASAKTTDLQNPRPGISGAPSHVLPDQEEHLVSSTPAFGPTAGRSKFNRR